MHRCSSMLYHSHNQVDQAYHMEPMNNGALPSLPSLPAKHMAGPTPFSNWVIPGRIIAGAYPASMDDVETEQLLTLLLELGINTFVCLQAEVNIHIPEHAWRSGMGLRPYIKDAQRILSRAHETNSTRIKQRKIDFLHLPIIDGSVTTDTAMSRLADDCCERVLKGEKMYIHCWGGHGRTGTLVATMLGRLYNLPYSTALRYTQGYHDTRVYPQGVRSPQTTVQRAQVRRLLLLPSAIPAMALCQSAAATPVSPSSSLNKNTSLSKSFSGNCSSNSTFLSNQRGNSSNVSSPQLNRSGSSGNTSRNIGLSSSSSMKEPATPTRAAGISSPLTPVKQSARSANSPFSWTPPVAGSRVSAPASIGAAGNSSSTMFSSTAACRRPTSATKRTTASSAPGRQQQSGQQYSGAPAGLDSGDVGSTHVAGLLGCSSGNSGLLQQQQRLAGTAVMLGSSPGGGAAAGGVRSSTAAAALLRTAGPRTPVQARMTTSLSSKGSLLKRGIDV